MIIFFMHTVANLQLMENPARHSGYQDWSRSVTEMLCCLGAHEAQPETAESHP